MKKILLFAIIFSLTAAYAQIDSLTVSGEITTGNGPVHPAGNLPLALYGEGIDTSYTVTGNDGYFLFRFLLEKLQPPVKRATGFSAVNFPNPFNPHTTIQFTLPKPEDVTIEVYARDARLVKTLLDGHMTAGTHEVQWDARNNNGTRVAEGLYFYVLRTKSGHTEHGKMLYLHGQMPVKAYAPSSGLMGLHKTSGDSLDMILEMAETDSTQANQITFKVHKDGGTYTVNGTVAYKNFPPETIAQQKNMTAPEDSSAVTSPMDSLFYDFNGNDELTFTVNNLPEGSIAQLNEGRIEIRAPENYNGTLEGITITASDGQYEATTDPFSIAYTPVNDAPATSVPDITVPRGDSVKIDLNQYVNDVDNTPNEMKWQASDYDTSIVEILIDSLNQATIKSRGKNGSTPVKWTARDPDGAEGQNQAGIDIELAYLLTIKTWDPVDDGIWPNDTLTVITPDGRKQVVTDSEGTARVYVPSDTGRVLVPYNSRHYETQQGFNRVTKDGILIVPIAGREFPLGDFVTFQGGTKYATYAYITRWDPRFINKAKNPEDPDTLRYAYIEPDTLESEQMYIGYYKTLRDTIMSWNKWVFPRMTRGRLVVMPLDMSKNVDFYGPQSLDDEIDESGVLMDQDNELPDNAGASQLVTYYGLTNSSLVNDRPGEPDYELHFATRGQSDVNHHNPPGVWLEEMGNTMLAMHGENGTEWRNVAVYGGHAQWPPFVEFWPYRGKEIAGEEIIGNFKFGLPVHTKVMRTGKIFPPRKSVE